MERYGHKCQTKKKKFIRVFLSPLNSLFDFFSLSQPVFSLSLFLLHIRFPTPPLPSTSNVFLFLCTSNQTQINFFLLSLLSGKATDWRQGFLDHRSIGYDSVVDCGSSLLSSLPPSPIKPPPSPLV